jgi:hypothetical protein
VRADACAWTAAEVLARAAIYLVSTWTAAQGVVAALTSKDVSTLATAEHVSALAATEDVAARPSQELHDRRRDHLYAGLVVSSPAHEAMSARSPGDPLVRAWTAIGDDVAAPTIHLVVAGPTDHDVAMVTVAEDGARCEGVVTRATVGTVAPGASVQDVVAARAPVEDVVTATANKVIAEVGVSRVIAAIQAIVALVPLKVVATVSAADQVVAFPPEYPLGWRIDHIRVRDIRPGTDAIVPRPREDDVVAAQPDDHVIPGRANQPVRAVRANNRGRLPEASRRGNHSQRTPTGHQQRHCQQPGCGPHHNSTHTHDASRYPASPRLPCTKDAGTGRPVREIKWQNRRRPSRTVSPTAA